MNCQNWSNAGQYCWLNRSISVILMSLATWKFRPLIFMSFQWIVEQNSYMAHDIIVIFSIVKVGQNREKKPATLLLIYAHCISRQFCWNITFHFLMGLMTKWKKKNETKTQPTIRICTHNVFVELSFSIKVKIHFHHIHTLFDDI